MIYLSIYYNYFFSNLEAFIKEGIDGVLYMNGGKKDTKTALKFKDRFLSAYMGNKKAFITMPRFYKEEISDTKLQEILTVGDAEIGKVTGRFWDPFFCLPLRKIYNTYTT